MSSATSSLNGWSFSKSSSGETSRSGGDEPSSHGAESTAVFHATSSTRSSSPSPPSPASGSTESRYTLRKPFRCSSWYSSRAFRPWAARAERPISSRKVVYSSPSSSRATNRVFPDFVWNVWTSWIRAVFSMPETFPPRANATRPRELACECVVEPGGHAFERQPLLGERVAVADGDGAVLQRHVIDREGPRRADLVLPPVAPPDVSAVVVLHEMPGPQLLVEPARRLDHSRVRLGDERQHRRLDRRDRRVQAQERALAPLDLFLGVRVDQHREQDPVDRHRGLDHVRRVARAVGIDVLELRAGSLGMSLQVVLAAVRDALELRPADGVEVFDVARRERVVRPLVGPVLADPELRVAQAELSIPAHPLLDPVRVPAIALVRRDEELHLHLLELAQPEEEVPRRDLVAERLADLRDAERRPPPGQLEDVLEVDEDALRGLRPQVGGGAPLDERAHRGLEHQVELARLGQVAVGSLARLLARLAAALRVCEPVAAEPDLAGAAVDERVGEALDVAGRLPDARVEDDRRVEGDDVVALLKHRREPAGADVVLPQAPVVAVVVRRAEPAVDLGGREDEPAPAAEGDDLVHRREVGRHGAYVIARP